MRCTPRPPLLPLPPPPGGGFRRGRGGGCGGETRKLPPRQPRAPQVQEEPSREAEPSQRRGRGRGAPPLSGDCPRRPLVCLSHCLRGPVCLGVSVPACVSLFLIALAACRSPCSPLPGFVPLQLFLCLSAVSASLRISLPRGVSRHACLSVALQLCLSLPFTSWSPSLRLAAPARWGLQQSYGAAWGHLGALTGVPFPVTSTCPSPRHGLRPPSAAGGWGLVGGSRGRSPGGKTQCPASAREPEAPDLAAAMKGSGSRGSEMVVIASATQRRSQEPPEEPARERGSETKTPAPSVYAKHPPAGDPGVPAPGPARGTGSCARSCCRPRRASAFPPPAPRGAAGRAGPGGAGAVDVIGADAAVSSIMDGDDADGGAEPARRGED